jgi:hypothetical protein
MSDLFKSISSPLIERARSPLLGTYIISWCISNWQIFYATIFITNKELYPSDKLIFVKEHVSNWQCFIYPLGFTIIYLFIVPYANYWIFMFSEKRKRKRIDLKIKIGREHFVSGNEYYDLKLKFEEEQKKVINFDSILKQSQTEISELINNLNLERNAHNTLRSDTGKLNDAIDQLATRSDMAKFMNGRWWSERDGNKLDEINFQETTYQTRQKDQWRDNFHIVGVDLDLNSKKFHFTKMRITPVSNEINVLFNDLSIIDRNRLEGKENGLIITYHRRTVKEK